MANYIGATELRKGVVYEDGGTVWKVLDYKHIKVARGGATVRVKVQGVATDVITEKTYNSDHKVEEADVFKRTAQYLYHDESQVHFMDSEDYSQFALSSKDFGESIYLLQEGQKVVTLFLDGNPISIELPKSIEMQVEYAPDAVAGDSATGASKKVKMTTGLEIDAPLFVKTGDILKINTDTVSYVGRV